jgi:hypothetical protein
MLSPNSTFGDSTDFTPAPVEDAELHWLLRALFAESAPEVEPPTCGFDAACERAERHLTWFERVDPAEGVAA